MTKVSYVVTVISVLFCTACLYFVYALVALARTFKKDYPSFKGSQSARQVLITSVKSEDEI